MKSQKAKSCVVFSVLMAILFGINACSSIQLFKSEDETKIENMSYKLGLLYAKDCPENACIAYTFCQQFEMAYREDYRVFLDAAVTHLNNSQLSDDTKGVLKDLLKELNIENRQDIYKNELDYSLCITIAGRVAEGIVDGITKAVCSPTRQISGY